MGVQITSRNYEIVLAECSTFVSPEGVLFRKGEPKRVPEEVSDQLAQALLKEHNMKGIPYFRKVTAKEEIKPDSKPSKGGKVPAKAKEPEQEPEKKDDDGLMDTGAVTLPEEMKTSEVGRGGKVVKV
jgi:hypothetical protein